jgi:pimeloyl-ACP methyl ester carboxylesterase
MATSMDMPTSQIDGNVDTFSWVWQNQTYPITYEIRGKGAPVLLLPAFSTVSSRSEMQGLAEHLSTRFQVVAIDWLGFGQSARPALDYCPALYQKFLQDFVQARFTTPIAVIAAGHAAGYVMHLARQSPETWSKIVLVAPTWRGPLPTMGMPTAVADAIRQLVRSPILGQFLYKLNTHPAFLRWMYRRHVYTDATRLTPALLTQKWSSTQMPGGRFAPAAFVTGGLDPVCQRTDFLSTFQALSAPVLVIIGEQTPPKSRAEMEILAHVTGIQTHRMTGTLGLHEEHATALAAIVLPFLQK